MRFLEVLLILFFARISVGERIRRNYCIIPQETLHKLHEKIRAEVNGEIITQPRCDSLVEKLNYNSASLRNKQKDLKDTFLLEHKKGWKNVPRIQKVPRKNLENVLKDKRSLIIKTEFYTMFSSSVKWVTRKKPFCTLNDGISRIFLSILKETYEMMTGDKSNDDCETLIEKMMNVAAIVKISKNYRNQTLEFLNKTFPVEVEFALGNLTSETKKLKSELKIKAESFILNALENKSFRLANEAFSLIDEENIEKILITAYNCNEENLITIIDFVNIYQESKMGKILNQMEICRREQRRLSNITDTLDDLVENIQNGDIKSAVDHIMTNQENVDVPKLVKLAYNGNVINFKPVRKFIDELSYQKLETVLYDEMMVNGHIDTVQHVFFAEWLSEKIKKLKENSSPQSELEEMKTDLEKLEKRLPEGLKNLFFEPNFGISTPSFSLKSFEPDILKFKLVFNQNSFYEIIDTEDREKLLLMNLDKEKVVTFGNGTNSGSYKWKIIPTDNANLYYIRNIEGFYMSSDELRRCEHKETGECGAITVYNIAYPEPAENTKWKITSNQNNRIRNKFLNN